MTFEESVRQRPYMYIGNDGITGLLNGLITDCIELCGTDNMLFEITISADNQFILSITTQHDINRFRQSFSEQSLSSSHHPQVLKAIAGNFEIKIAGKKTDIRFSIDNDVMTDTAVDYITLSEEMLLTALLNRSTEIVITDKRAKHLNQNYYHFPQGIFYLFDRAQKAALGKPEFSICFDGKINGNQYQLGLAYRTDWYPQPYVVVFANNKQTISSGALVDGALDGLVHACKVYKKENDREHFKINRNKLGNGLILFAAVRGQALQHEGNCKDILKDETVRKEIKKIVAELALDFFRTQKEKAEKFLGRFDTTQLTSEMFRD